MTGRWKAVDRAALAGWPADVRDAVDRPGTLVFAGAVRDSGNVIAAVRFDGDHGDTCYAWIGAVRHPPEPFTERVLSSRWPALARAIADARAARPPAPGATAAKDLARFDRLDAAPPAEAITAAAAVDLAYDAVQAVRRYLRPLTGDHQEAAAHVVLQAVAEVVGWTVAVWDRHDHATAAGRPLTDDEWAAVQDDDRVTDVAYTAVTDSGVLALVCTEAGIR